jgi:hypothetical protein
MLQSFLDAVMASSSASSTTTLSIPRDYAYVIGVWLLFWLQQSIIFVLPVAKQRKATGIAAPTLYPTDKQIDQLKLKPAQVQTYLCAQRVHQQNVEFLVVYTPLLLISGLNHPARAAAAGLLVWLGRLVFALGYWAGPTKRNLGAW